MKPVGVLTVFLLQCMAQASVAMPCVGPAFDVPMPGADGVASHIADLPSVVAPGLWQTGNLDGFRYRLFANGDGELSSESSTWTIAFSCSQSEASCAQSREGNVPVEAIGIAEKLQSCFLGQELVEPPKPQEVTAPPVKEPCGLDLVDESNDEKALQKLLVLAGTTVGSIDGIIGPKSKAALASILGAAATSLSVQDAAEALNGHLCK